MSYGYTSTRAVTNPECNLDTDGYCQSGPFEPYKRLCFSPPYQTEGYSPLDTPFKSQCGPNNMWSSCYCDGWTKNCFRSASGSGGNNSMCSSTNLALQGGYFTPCNGKACRESMSSVVDPVTKMSLNQTWNPRKMNCVDHYASRGNNIYPSECGTSLSVPVGDTMSMWNVKTGRCSLPGWQEKPAPNWFPYSGSHWRAVGEISGEDLKAYAKTVDPAGKLLTLPGSLVRAQKFNHRTNRTEDAVLIPFDLEPQVTPQCTNAIRTTVEGKRNQLRSMGYSEAYQRAAEDAQCFVYDLQFPNGSTVPLAVKADPRCRQVARETFLQVGGKCGGCLLEGCKM